MTLHSRSIAILGGTGSLGSGLARRFAHVGHKVIIGSRDPANFTNREVNFGPGVRVGTYHEAVLGADIAFLTVPFAAQAQVLQLTRGGLEGKILVDATVPLVPPKVAQVRLPPEGAAAVIAQSLLGEKVRVVSALHNVSAAHLMSVEEPIDCDVLVCADKLRDRDEVINLIEDIGLRGLHAGSLANSAAAEALTSVLIFINRHYKSDRAGLRILGI